MSRISTWLALGMVVAVALRAAAAPQATRPDQTSREPGELRPGRTGLPTSPAVVDTPASTAPASQDGGRAVGGTEPLAAAQTTAETAAQTRAQHPATTAAPTTTGASRPASAEILWERPTPPVPDLSPRWVPITPSDRSRSSADAGALRGVRVLSITGGVARLQLPSEPQPRSLRVGDRIGTDTVVRVEAARVVLTRPAGPGEKGDATVVLKPGRDGLGFVRVYRVRDPATPDGGAGEAR